VAALRADVDDVVDTAQALQVKEASTLIHSGLVELLAVLKRRAVEFKHTPTIGRTHGISCGADDVWVEAAETGLRRWSGTWHGLMRRPRALRVGKLSGAVGTFDT